ncbi:HK97-gp10 family putative phage morphogenesis protein [Xenorhabdus ehlersii]|uniref:HK97 gp10 family phage protein n=1 Tax=Xenorhabdus ehlersii TaxID=290111 RepID=A0A2D0IKS7_9GAMM|nr:HK97-gp10 family putative phage morphogenesis protein [Xenorhabdus ehlersii]PHM22292.1 HK97 gp10 family phage protein [Xenorhabdus ehlersii]RKE87864.1 HK97 gp10 family phage protein [Xenorhabdus ehlersii]
MTIVDFSGFRELSRDLELLSKAESDKVLRKGTYAGAKILRDETRKRAPVRTGKLKKNIMAVNRRKQRDGSISSGVYVRGSNKSGTNSDTRMKKNDPRNAYYWRFLEKGTSKMAPQPFIDPTFDAKADEAANVAFDIALKAIDEVLAK